MKKRLFVAFMLAAIVVVLLLSAWLFVPNLLVQYHLAAIADDRDAAQHIASLVRMRGLARPELFRVLEAQTRLGPQATLHPDPRTARCRAACALALATAYQNHELSREESSDFVRDVFAAEIRGIDRRIVRCLLPIRLEWPDYVAQLPDGSPAVSFSIDPTFIFDDQKIPAPRSAQGSFSVVGGAAEQFRYRRGSSLAQGALQFFVERRPEFYVDFTKLALGRHTMQARLVLTDSSNHTSEEISTERIEFWVVEPKEP